MFVPITRLLDADRPRIEEHLLRLSPQDRSLRFAAGIVPDAIVRRHVAGMRTDSDLVLGMVSKRGQLIGLAHGCVYQTQGRQGRTHVEAAFSVDAPWRGHGVGTQLMNALLATSRSLGPCTVVGLCAARNLRMRRIFENALMEMTREDDEWLARREVSGSLTASPVAS